jgi:hypothetical protein
MSFVGIPVTRKGLHSTSCEWRPLLHLYTAEGDKQVSQVHVQQGHTAHCFLEPNGLDPGSRESRNDHLHKLCVAAVFRGRNNANRCSLAIVGGDRKGTQSQMTQ